MWKNMMDQQSFRKASPGKKARLDLTNYRDAKSTLRTKVLVTVYKKAFPEKRLLPWSPWAPAGPMLRTEEYSFFHGPSCHSAGENNGVWKIQALLPVLGQNTSTWKTTEKIIADLPFWATSPMLWLDALLLFEEETKLIRDWINGTHPAFVPCSAPKMQFCGPYCLSAPKDDRTLLMEAVSSVVLADLQFHQLTSACWDSTKLLIG